MQLRKESALGVVLANKFFRFVTKQDHLWFLPVFLLPIFSVNSSINPKVDKFLTITVGGCTKILLEKKEIL